MKITIDTDGEKFYVKAEEHWEAYYAVNSWEEATKIIEKEILPNARYIE